MSSESVRVAVRIRPPAPGAEQVARCVGENSIFVTCDDAIAPDRTFAFDYAQAADGADIPGSQVRLFEALGKPLVPHVLLGYNVSVFAYGQTGSGKSFTMYGPHDVRTPSFSSVAEGAGLIPRFCQELYKAIRTKQNDGTKAIHTIEASYFQIYNEKVYDLVPTEFADFGGGAGAHMGDDLDVSLSNANKLRVREDPITGPYVEGLLWHAVESHAAIERLIHTGNMMRAVASTNMNASSSRSHAVLTLRYKCTRIDGDTGAVTDLRSKIVLVDLAGSERVSKTGAEGQRLKEAGKINKSLTALGMVIAALSKPGSTDADTTSYRSGHIPYRESTLTWLLKDTLGGNSKTLMIATISPSVEHMDETISTLRYAERAKLIKNTAIVNEDPNVALIRQLREEIMMLRSQLESLRAESSSNVKKGDDSDLLAKLEALTVQNKFQEQMLLQLHQEWRIKVEDSEARMNVGENALRELGMQLPGGQNDDDDGDWEDDDWGGQLDTEVKQSADDSEGAASKPTHAHPPKERLYLMLRQPDPQLDGQIMYALREGDTTIGSAPDNIIRLSSAGIARHHFSVHCNGPVSEVILQPEFNCDVWVNGRRVGMADGCEESSTTLQDGDRIVCGELPVVLHLLASSKSDLGEAAKLTGALYDWQRAIEEWKSASMMTPTAEYRTMRRVTNEEGTELASTVPYATESRRSSVEESYNGAEESSVHSSEAALFNDSLQSQSVTADVTAAHDTPDVIHSAEEIPVADNHEASPCLPEEAVVEEEQQVEDDLSSVGDFAGQLDDTEHVAVDDHVNEVPAASSVQLGGVDFPPLPPVESIARPPSPMPMLAAVATEHAKVQENVLMRWCDAALLPDLAQRLHSLAIHMGEVSALCSALGINVRLSRRALWMPPSCNIVPDGSRERSELLWARIVVEQDVGNWDCGVSAWTIPGNASKQPVALGMFNSASLDALRLELMNRYDGVLLGNEAGVEHDDMVALFRSLSSQPLHPDLARTPQTLARAYVSLGGVAAGESAGTSTPLQAVAITAWGAMLGVLKADVMYVPETQEILIGKTSLLLLHMNGTLPGQVRCMDLHIRLVAPFATSEAADGVDEHCVVVMRLQHSNGLFVSGDDAPPLCLKASTVAPVQVCALEVVVDAEFVPDAALVPVLVGSETERWGTLHAIPVVRLGNPTTQMFAFCKQVVPSVALTTSETLQLGVLADMMYFKADVWDHTSTPPRICIDSPQLVSWNRLQRDPIAGSSVAVSYEPVFMIEKMMGVNAAPGLANVVFDGKSMLAFCMSVTQYDAAHPFQIEGCCEARVTDVRRIHVLALGETSPAPELHATSTDPQDALPIWQHRDPDNRSLRMILPIPTAKSPQTGGLLATLAQQIDMPTPPGQRLYVRIQLTLTVRGCTNPIAFARWIAMEVKPAMRDYTAVSQPTIQLPVPPLEFSGAAATFVVPASAWFWYFAQDTLPLQARLSAIVRRCAVDISRHWETDAAADSAAPTAMDAAKLFVKHGMRFVSNVFQFSKPLLTAQSYDSLERKPRVSDNFLELIIPDQSCTTRIPRCESLKVVRVPTERSGYLLKRRAVIGGWIRRWYVLQSPFLYAYHSASEFDQSNEPSHIHHLATLQISDERGVLSYLPNPEGGRGTLLCTSRDGVGGEKTVLSPRSTSFTFELVRKECQQGASVVSPEKTWALQASSAEEKESWLMAVLQAIHLVAGVGFY